jgi:hypothetical protein
MVISADEINRGELSFTRYDYLWANRQINQVSITPVTNPDQLEFIQMMFDCSTTC